MVPQLPQGRNALFPAVAAPAAASARPARRRTPTMASLATEVALQRGGVRVRPVPQALAQARPRSRHGRTESDCGSRSRRQDRLALTQGLEAPPGIGRGESPPRPGRPVPRRTTPVSRDTFQLSSSSSSAPARSPACSRMRARTSLSSGMKRRAPIASTASRPLRACSSASVELVLVDEDPAAGAARDQLPARLADPRHQVDDRSAVFERLLRIEGSTCA